MKKEFKRYLGEFNFIKVYRDHREGRFKLLQEGNSKIDKGVLTFNLPPILSCPNCKDCAKDCYAVKAWKQYKNVRKAWSRNLILAMRYPIQLKSWLLHELTGHLRKANKRGQRLVVRIHSSGDMFNQDYLDMWTHIAEIFPQIKFYTYSKTKQILDFSEADGADNFNAIDSLIDGKVNFGPMEYCREIVKTKNAFLCPCYKDNPKAGIKVKCGKDCEYCVTGNRPVFVIH